MTKTEVLQKWFQRVWADRDLDAIDEYFAKDVVTEGLIPEMQVGRDEFRELVTAFCNLVGDIRIEIPKTLEDGDWLSALVHLHTCCADTGAPFRASGQVMVRFNQDNKMVEAYNQFDFISIFEQLGQMPPDTLPLCLTGQKLDLK